MPCALTQSYTLDCKDNMGGLKELYFASLLDIETITKTAGVISAITMVTGAKFYKYQLVKETAYSKETLTSNVQNGTIFYAQEIQMVLNKMKTNTRNEILLLAQNVLVAIALDRNGTYWLYGETRGVDATAGEVGSGTASGDRNGYSITFTGQEPALASEVTGSLIPDLLVAAE